MSFVLELQGMQPVQHSSDPASVTILSSVSLSLCSISTASVVVCLTIYAMES